MREEDDAMLDTDDQSISDDEDIILPEDEETAKADELAKQQKEYDGESKETQKEVERRAFIDLINMGYPVDQAEEYRNHPEVIKNTIDKMWEESFEEFAEVYPNVKPEEISEETWQAFKRTGDLIYSFENYDTAFAGLNEGLPKRKRTTGRGKKDPFLAGFEEEF